MPNPLKFLPLCIVFSLAFAIADAHAADVGVFSIVEGPVRVLRDTTWYKLAPGARVEQGDILAGNATGQVQVELAAGGAFNLGTPGTLFVAAISAPGDKVAGPAQLALPKGWLKIASTPPSIGFRVQMEWASLFSADGIVVIHAQPSIVELFVESSGARLSEVEQGATKSATGTDMKAGEFAALSADRPPSFERRAPAAFVTGIPRQLIDPLPALAAKYKAAKVQLVPEQEVTYAEAEPWLSGPYRKLFLKRFQPRLKDHAFRTGVEAHIARYPEWDRVLHPEKYLPKTPPTAK